MITAFLVRLKGYCGSEGIAAAVVSDLAVPWWALWCSKADAHGLLLAFTDFDVQSTLTVLRVLEDDHMATGWNLDAKPRGVTE